MPYFTVFVIKQLSCWQPKMTRGSEDCRTDNHWCCWRIGIQGNPAYRVGGRPRGDRNGSRVNNNTSLLTMCFRKGALACIWSTWTLNAIQIDTARNSIFKLVSGGISHATSVFLPVIHGGQFLLNSWQQATLLKAFQRAHYHVNAHPSTDGRLADWALKYTTT